MTAIPELSSEIIEPAGRRLVAYGSTDTGHALDGDTVFEIGSVTTIPVHFFALVSLGVHLFDNLGLEELAETANELNRWEFLFMASPHGVPNGNGSAINPLAVF